MKIAHLLPYYPAPAGTSKAVGGMANAVARNGHDVEIWTYQDCLITDPRHKAQLRRFTPPRGPSWIPSRDLRKYIAAHACDYDLVGIHGMFNPFLPLTVWCLRRAGARYLLCLHGAYHPALLRKNRLRKTLYWPLESFDVRHAAAIQVPTTNDVGFLRALGIQKPVIIVPNGFDPKDVPEKPLRPEPSETMRLLFLGRIEKHVKGLDLLIGALEKVRRRGLDVILDFVGPDWGDLAALQHLVNDLGLSATVRFLGADYQRPAHEILSPYDLLVLPSRTEGFGFVALEAMLNATPVLVTQEVGAAEHVRAANAGWIVPATAEGLAQGLDAAAGAKAHWPAYGMRGREYALANLGWDAIGARAAANYVRVIHGDAGPGEVLR